MRGVCGRIIKAALFAGLIFGPLCVRAEVIVTIGDIKTAGQKAVVALSIKNTFTEKITVQNLVCPHLSSTGCQLCCAGVFQSQLIADGLEAGGIIAGGGGVSIGIGLLDLALSHANDIKVSKIVWTIVPNPHTIRNDFACDDLQVKKCAGTNSPHEMALDFVC